MPQVPLSKKKACVESKKTAKRRKRPLAPVATPQTQHPDKGTDWKRRLQATHTELLPLHAVSGSSKAMAAPSPIPGSCPTVNGKPVVGGSGGARYVLGGTGGLAHAGRCHPRYFAQFQPQQAPESLVGGGRTQHQQEAEVVDIHRFPHSNSSESSSKKSSFYEITPRSIAFLAKSPASWNPPSRWFSAPTSVPTTPQRSASRTNSAPLKTPMSTFAPVMTPKYLTESAKVFHDALRGESSPLVLLASAASGVSAGVTPSPKGSSTLNISIPTFRHERKSDRDSKSDASVLFEAKAAIAGDGSPGVATFKRYGIRPKENKKSRRDLPDVMAGASVLSDLLFETPEQQHSVFTSFSSTTANTPTVSPPGKSKMPLTAEVVMSKSTKALPVK